MSRSNFGPKGLPLGENNANMTYLYGISDFFSIMFEDTSKVNLLLEGGAAAASEVYSKFLQMTSTISLEDIQSTLGQTLKLITIKSTDSVEGEINLYNLPEAVIKSRYIANRPLLPTTLFEQGVDYRLETAADGTPRVRFAKDISNAGFSTRLLADGSTKEFAMWLVDTEIDEQWISDYYAALIGIDPAASTDAFKNFVYGLYFVYINGPTLEMLRKGLNLCLGVPLAREIETVLDIRKYLETDQYIVITDQNQYLIPFGLDPIVEIDDVLSVGDELAQWIEVKDYVNDGEWWINLMIPSKLIPEVPPGQVNRYATEGSHFDYLMRQYLKKHTFLVNVKVRDFKNNQVFAQLSDIIGRAKPAYTEAVYVWTVQQLDEEIEMTEEIFVQRRDQARCDHIIYGIDKMYRGNSTDALLRGCPTFTRSTVPFWVGKLCGGNEYINGNPFDFEGGTVNGFINPMRQYRTNTDAEKAWLRAINERGSETLNMTRGMLGFSRGVHTASDASVSYRGVPVHPIYDWANVPTDMKVIPMYTTTQKDLDNKCGIIGIRTPDLSEWVFDLMNPLDISEEINALAINEGIPIVETSLLIQNFNTIKARGTDVHYLSNITPPVSFDNVYAPASTGELTLRDYILGVRIYDNVLGIYLVTANPELKGPSYFVMEENDQLVIGMTVRPARALGPTSSSWYLVRGRGTLNYNNVRSEINAATINDGEGLDGPELTVEFSDSANPVPVTMTRGGTPIAHRMEIK